MKHKKLIKRICRDCCISNFTIAKQKGKSYLLFDILEGLTMPYRDKYNIRQANFMNVICLDDLCNK